jgi:hypothetical protein
MLVAIGSHIDGLAYLAPLGTSISVGVLIQQPHADPDAPFEVHIFHISMSQGLIIIDTDASGRPLAGVGQIIRKHCCTNERTTGVISASSREPCNDESACGLLL